MTVTTVEDEASFQTELQKAGGKLVVIEFTAQWCGPCKQFSPVFEGFSKKFNSVVFLKVDVDDNQDLAMQYEVSAMPTFLFLKKQKELDRILGADAETVESRIKELGSRKRSKSPSRHHPGQIQQQPEQNQIPHLEVSPSNFHKDDSSRVDAANNKLQMMNVSGLDLNAHAATIHNLQQLQLLNMQQEEEEGQGQFRGPQIMANHPHLGPNQLINYGADQNFPMAQLSSQFPKPSSQLVISQSGGIAENIPSNNPLGPTESQGQKDIYNSNEEEEASGSKNEIRETPSRDPKRVAVHKKKSAHRTKSSSRKESTRGPAATHGKPARPAKPDSESKSSSWEHKGGTGLKKKPPVSSVQIRLADGTKLNANFSASQPISKIREFILNAQPEHAARPFTLNAIMPHREITNEAMSLQEAKLTNSVIVQRFGTSS